MNICQKCFTKNIYTPRPECAAPDVAGDAELEVLLAGHLGEAGLALEAGLEAVQGDGVAHPEAGVGAHSAVQQAVRQKHKVTGVSSFSGHFHEFPLLHQFPSRHDHLSKWKSDDKYSSHSKLYLIITKPGLKA